MTSYARKPCTFCRCPNTERRQGNRGGQGEVFHWVECQGCHARGPRSTDPSMILIRVRAYGSSEHTDIGFDGELKDQLSQQFLAALRAGFIWPGYAEDYHLTMLKGNEWVEV